MKAFRGSSFLGFAMDFQNTAFVIGFSLFGGHDVHYISWNGIGQKNDPAIWGMGYGFSFGTCIGDFNLLKNFTIVPFSLGAKVVF